MKDRPLTDFDKTVLEQMERIRAIGRKHLRDQNELDDFVQETIARVYANRSRLRDPAKLRQWIAGVARNTANEWNRAFYRKRREQPLPDEAELTDERNPLDALEQAERNEQIRQALNRLSPADRDLLRGRYMDEESYEALQNRHGLSYSAVGIRLHRAKQRLKKILNGMKIALVLPLVNLTRNAFGGIVLMTKSTKIVFTALGAAFLAVFLICYFIFVVDSGDAPENTLTIDQQTPRVESLQTKRDGLKETPAQPEQEDASASEDAVQSVPFDNSGSADNRSGVQSDAPQVEAQDSFTAEFQEAADEYIEFGKKLVEAFPHYPVAHTKNKNYSQLFAHLKEYNEELSRQNLSREDRVAKLNARLINFGRKLARASHTDAGPLATSYTPEERAAIKTQYFDYIDENAPAKLFTLLGVERRSHWRRAPWMQPIP